MLSKSSKWHKYKRLSLYISILVKIAKMKNIKIILLINWFFMIIDNSKIVKIHFVSFIFLGNVKGEKTQNTIDVFL